MITFALMLTVLPSTTHAQSRYTKHLKPMNPKEACDLLKSSTRNPDEFQYIEGRGCVRKGETPKPDNVATTPQHTPVRLLNVTGDVSIRNASGAWQEATTATDIMQGSEISTGPGSTITMQFEDGSTMVLSELTQIKIDTVLNKNDRLKAQMILKLGELKAKANPLKTLSTDFSVKTPTATTSVRGTIFSVAYNEKNKAAVVRVAEGTVAVEPTIAPKSTSKKTTTLVHAGSKLTAPSKGVWKTTALSPKEILDLNTAFAPAYPTPTAAPTKQPQYIR